jgi:hypothetical protein
MLAVLTESRLVTSPERERSGAEGEKTMFAPVHPDTMIGIMRQRETERHEQAAHWRRVSRLRHARTRARS